MARSRGLGDVYKRQAMKSSQQKPKYLHYTKMDLR
jgi:hypothetical protein